MTKTTAEGKYLLAGLFLWEQLCHGLENPIQAKIALGIVEQLDTLTRRSSVTLEPQLSQWKSGKLKCQGVNQKAVMSFLENSARQNSLPYNSEAVKEALDYLYKFSDELNHRTVCRCDIRVPKKAREFLDTKPGNFNWAPEPGETSGLSARPAAEVSLQFLIDALYAAALAPQDDRPVTADTLTLRHAQLHALAECHGAPKSRFPVCWLPRGNLNLPDGRLAYVDRPVAIMTRPMSCADIPSLRPQSGTNPCNVMATGLSMLSARQYTDTLATQSPFFWRLPSVAEWWMAITAGTGVMRSSSYRGGLWLSDIPKNTWRVVPPPHDAMEWVHDAEGQEGAMAANGERKALRPDVPPERVGFRLVLDWRAGQGLPT